MSSENEILAQLALVATPSAVAFYILWKVVIPWSNWWLNKQSNNGLKEKLEQIEKNELHECRETKWEFHEFKKEIWSVINDLRRETAEQGERISRIEGRLNSKRA